MRRHGLQRWVPMHTHERVIVCMCDLPLPPPLYTQRIRIHRSVESRVVICLIHCDVRPPPFAAAGSCGQSLLAPGCPPCLVPTTLPRCSSSTPLFWAMMPYQLVCSSGACRRTHSSHESGTYLFVSLSPLLLASVAICLCLFQVRGRRVDRWCSIRQYGGVLCDTVAR